MEKFMEALLKEDLENIVDETAQKVFKYLIDKKIESQGPKHPNDTSPCIIEISPKELEKWFQHALGGKLTGNGNGAIDLELENYQVDVKLVTQCYKSMRTNEVSLIQIFNDNGRRSPLDSLFKEKKYNKILSIWKKKLKEKYLSETKPHIIILLIRTETKVFIMGFRININALNKIKILKNTKGRTKGKSIFLKGIIDPNLGDAKIYISKRRLEVRFSLKNIYKYAIEIDVEYKNEVEDLRSRFSTV